MAEEVAATFWEVFSETSSIDLVRLLPWCISTTANPGAIPTHYMSGGLATTMQQRVDAPAATTAPESMVTCALASTSSPACPTETPPILILPMLDILLISTPSWAFICQVHHRSPAHKVGSLLCYAIIGAHINRVKSTH